MVRYWVVWTVAQRAGLMVASKASRWVVHWDARSVPLQVANLAGPMADCLAALWEPPLAVTTAVEKAELWAASWACQWADCLVALSGI